ncbi:MAG: ACT domain-containing protein [Candidatus Micrarchaeota archaeon]
MAISDLDELLKNMAPKVVEGKHHFASVDEGNLMAVANYLSYVVDVFREEEGLSIVFQEDILEGMKELSDKEVLGPFAMITLSVNSDLTAVGFLAKVADALAKEGISSNVFSAYHHDHLFVPYEKKDDAMRVLRRLSGPGRG